MPLYEYQCANCKKVHEVMQKFSDPQLAECPECQGPVTKLVSLGSFSLKGSGWYTTDYKRAGQKPASEKSEAKTTAAAAATPAAPAAPVPTSAKPTT